MLLLNEKHKELAEWLAAELSEVEVRFAVELHSDITPVNDLVRHLEQYRGKMLRPTLLLLIGRAVTSGGGGDAHRTLATVVEMAHMATLVHDDILDEAEVRRCTTTVNALRGNEAAVMLGDYLISHAYHLCSSLDSQAASRLIAAATDAVCEGELLQLSNRYNWSLDEHTYFQIIRRKTGALVGVACRLGAMFSGADKSACDAMSRFGIELGAAFQIIDDVLDLVGNQQVVGKSLGKDLEKGKLTLPLIHTLETAGPADRQKLVNLLRADDHDRAVEVGRIIAASPAIDHAKRRAAAIIATAKAQLQVLPAGDVRDLLASMADAVLTRQA